jgi:hypothetical protein
MKPIYSIRFLVILFSIALFNLGGCQKGSEEEMMRRPPPTKPPATPPPVLGANTNPLPPGIQGATPDWSVTGVLPQILGCGQQYEIEVITQEKGINCSGYNYAPIYNRAHTLAVTRIYSSLGGSGSVTCPQACSPIHSWQIHRSWSCIGGIASAYVRYGVLCPNTGQPKPTHAPFVLPVPSLSSGSPYNPPNVPPSTPVDSIKENHVGTSTPTPGPFNPDAACPSIDTKYIQYFENVQSCQNLNFAPYIARAEKWAELHHNMQSCVRPCSKKPFSVINRRWNCSVSPGLVDVDITYNLNCQRP